MRFTTDHYLVVQNLTAVETWKGTRALSFYLLGLPVMNQTYEVQTSIMKWFHVLGKKLLFFVASTDIHNLYSWGRKCSASSFTHQFVPYRCLVWKLNEVPMLGTQTDAIDG